MTVRENTSTYMAAYVIRPVRIISDKIAAGCAQTGTIAPFHKFFRNVQTSPISVSIFKHYVSAWNRAPRGAHTSASELHPHPSLCE